MKDRNGLSVVLDHDFRTRAYPCHERFEIARRIGFRDVNYMLGHNDIIHRYSRFSAVSA